MLEYTKTILQKVSFSPALFAKELRKSMKWLKNDEVNALQSWCVVTFGEQYPDVIHETFNNRRA
jgi:hypothetical protein